MNSNTINFNGRKINAIGKLSKIEHTCIAPKLKDAILMLYNDFEHVSIISVIKRQNKVNKIINENY